MRDSFYLTTLADFGDARGGMCVVEGGRDVPFDIRRFFYDFHTTGSETRGNHANRESRFAFISVAGSCSVTVDDGVQRETFLLDDPHKLLCVDKMTWKVMGDFSPDNVLLVVSDHHYDGGEYIRNYDEFLEACRTAREGETR